MSMKLKVLGLGLLAVMATSAFAVMSASANTTGHFTSDKAHTILHGTESRPGNHNLSFQRVNAAGEAQGKPIQCTNVAYHGTTSVATTTAVQLTPVYSNCGTEGEPHNVFVHHPSSCGTNVFEFTSGGNGTVHVRCKISVTHPNCGIGIPTQTLSGVTYNTDFQNGVHAITAGVAVKGITGHFHSGVCVFLGTSHIFNMTGSVTLEGKDTEGNPVGITAT
jgi:hypothetical protein